MLLKSSLSNDKLPMHSNSPDLRWHQHHYTRMYALIRQSFYKPNYAQHYPFSRKSNYMLSLMKKFFHLHMQVTRA